MPNNVNIVTTCFHDTMHPDRTPEENFELALELLNSVRNEKPDIVCFPETFISIYHKDYKRIGIDRIFDEFSRRARDMKCYITATVLENRDDSVKNTGWLIDRSGCLAGKYDKYHTTEFEMKNGIMPGSEIPVFETDFGKLGFSICYDIRWPDFWSKLKSKGAEIVIWMSEYDGGFPLQCYGFLNDYFVVSSSRRDYSKIIDKTGEILACSSPWVYYTSYKVNLDKEMFHVHGQYEKLESIMSRFGTKLTVKSYYEENIFTLESQDDQWPVEKLIKEYGLEIRTQNTKRVEMIQSEYRGRE